MRDSDFYAALLALRQADVDFLVVGGLAAVLNGAPVNTFDLDIVHSRAPSNIARLLKVLVITRSSPLDVLGMIGSNLEYQDLLPHTVELEIGESNDALIGNKADGGAAPP